jgi:transporter family-2 protein
MTALLTAFAILAGILNTVQSGANVTLTKATGQPIVALFVVAVTGTLTYAAAIPFVGIAWPGAERFAAVPWWAWTGGVLGGIYVLSVVFVAPVVGAAAFTGITVTTGLVTSLVLDHFGWLGFEVHAAGLWRILGGALMVLGVALVCLF